MKKITALLMALCMVASLVTGCTTASQETAAPAVVDKPAAASDEVKPAKETEASTEAATDAGWDEAAFIAKYIQGRGVKADGTPLKVAMDVSDMSSQCIVYIYDYIIRLLELAGAEVTGACSNNDLITQAGNVDDYIASGVDAIVLHATDAQGSAEYLNKINEAGIASICMVKQVEGASMDFFCDISDNYNTGYKAAAWAADAIEGDVNVLVIQGNMTASDAYLRMDGIEALAAERDDFHVVAAIDCNWDPTKAESAVIDALTAHPEINMILGESDCMATGIQSALVQMGYTDVNGDKHMMWSNIDGDPVGTPLVQAGWIDHEVVQSPLTVAITVVRAILDYVAVGEECPGIIVPNPTTEMDASNCYDVSNWANYDIKSSELWPQTEEVWTAYDEYFEK